MGSLQSEGGRMGEGILDGGSTDGRSGDSVAL